MKRKNGYLNVIKLKSQKDKSLINIFILLFLSRYMERKTRILPIIILLCLIFLSRAEAQTPKQVQFYFFDENNCSLNGYLFNGDTLIGKTENGFFNLTYNTYKNRFDLDYDITLFGKLGNCSSSGLYFDKSWESFEIEDYYFSGESLFKFQASIHPNNPSKRELLGFIQPDSVKGELKNINFTGETLEDLSKINQYLNDKINYTEDWDFNKEENYWQTPQETLRLKQGDCEDYSTTLLSLFSAYNRSLNCYNVIFSSHVATLCYIEDYYIYYDQQKTELRKKITSKNGGTESKLLNLKEEYFQHYGINDSERAYYVFNEYRFLEFKDDKEFINWQFAISNKKQGIDLFKKLEQDLSKIPEEKNQEYQEETIELRTEQPELPTIGGFFKEYFLLLVLLGGILLTLIILLIFINLKRKS
jgi:hypothetical protein